MYYYKTYRTTVLGKKLTSFMEKSEIAARASERYAKKCGALAYIQPVQYFEGGVEFLEFEKEPDLNVWRKRTDLGDTPLYEPNCSSESCYLATNDDKFTPSSTWNKLYATKAVHWDQVKYEKPIEYWMQYAKITPTEDEKHNLAAYKEMYAKMLDDKLGKMLFWRCLRFTGPQKPQDRRAKSSRALHKAVKMEQMRIALPVVQVQELYDILDCALSDRKSEQEQYTPTLFLYKDHYYIGVQYKCSNSELTEIEKSEHNYQMEQYKISLTYKGEYGDI
ncbi:MAG: hypothetical protein HUK05_08830 [Prevotella sp.]|nr:hypothetical protein [Prevotella sp.]MCF0243435.1 hypothetical protein [Bacteroidaceae bacterium]